MSSMLLARISGDFFKILLRTFCVDWDLLGIFFFSLRGGGLGCWDLVDLTGETVHAVITL